METVSAKLADRCNFHRQWKTEICRHMWTVIQIHMWSRQKPHEHIEKMKQVQCHIFSIERISADWKDGVPKEESLDLAVWGK